MPAAMVAVKVTGAPRAARDGEAARAVVVGTKTVNDTGAEVEAALTWSPA
jgi:hypothetical protein